MDYHLTLTGLQILLRTPHEISISESLRPFLCPGKKDPDCTIALQSCHPLPALPPDGAWHGPEYYSCQAGSLQIFHCHTPQGTPFAVTELLEDGNIAISVLPECLSYFSGTAGIFNRIGLETLLLQHKGLLLHASLINYCDKAIAFSGPSGVGKSTQAELWRVHSGAEIINGDRAALRTGSGGWIAYGSPYAGTSGIYKNAHAPLAAIILLQQGAKNQLCRLTPAEAFPRLYPELTIHHWDKTFVSAATDLCLQLLTETPVYLLVCRPEESAVQLVKKGLGL